MQNQSDTMDLTLVFEGAGLSNVSVTWQATGGTITPSASETDSDGRSNVLFHPSATGIANITAVISHPAFGDTSISAQVIVIPVPTRQAPSMESELLSPAPFVHVPYLAFAVAVAALVIVFVMMRRGTKVEEVVEEGYETASLS